MRLVYLICILSIASSVSSAQNFTAQQARNTPLSWKDSASLHFEFSNTNFFKNNEYSNEILNGYTLFGFNATPKFTYYLSKNTKITGGANFLKYFGEETFHEIKPVFRVQQNFSPNLSLIIGTIHNSNCHGLIKPLYHPELLITDPTEYGLQFLFQNRRFNIDLWLDWQRFITNKSDFQEEFITGLNAETQLLSQSAPLELFIPLQTVIEHKGGQIGEQDKPISTIANTAIGVGAKIPIRSDKNYLQLKQFVSGYHKITNKNEAPYNKGVGFYSRLNVRIHSFDLNFGYWQGSKYLSIAGDPIYQSYSLKKDEKLPKRKMLEAGLQYSQRFPFAKFMANFTGIYDLLDGNSDYYIGLYLYVDLDRIILKP